MTPGSHTKEYMNKSRQSLKTSFVTGEKRPSQPGWLPMAFTAAAPGSQPSLLLLMVVVDIFIGH